MAALAPTVEPQLDGPRQATVQSLPLQLTAPWQDPSPEQVMVAVSPPPATVDAHEPAPLQVSVQVPFPPPQRMGCEQA